MQLSIALQGVVTQQLLPTADGSARIAGCEVLVPTPAIRNLIREGRRTKSPGASDLGRGRDADDGFPPGPAGENGQDHASLAEQRPRCRRS